MPDRNPQEKTWVLFDLWNICFDKNRTLTLSLSKMT